MRQNYHCAVRKLTGYCIFSNLYFTLLLCDFFFWPSRLWPWVWILVLLLISGLTFGRLLKLCEIRLLKYTLKDCFKNYIRWHRQTALFLTGNRSVNGSCYLLPYGHLNSALSFFCKLGSPLFFLECVSQFS